MRKLLTVVAAVWTLAGSAHGAEVIDFEDGVVGQFYQRGFFSAWPVQVADESGNKFLALNYEEGGPPVEIRIAWAITQTAGFGDPPETPKFRITPVLESFDILSPDSGRVWEVFQGDLATFPAGASTVSMNFTPIAQIFTISLSPHTSGQIRLDNFRFHTIVSPIPEPSTWALMISGFGLLGAALRRSHRRGFLAAA